MEKCCQKDCSERATRRMFWPGNPPKPVCEGCAEKGLRIAEAMGFYLHVEELKEEDTN